METRCPDYKHEAGAIDGLVQQIAVSYLRHGYFYYVSGYVKPGVPLERHDRYILEGYNIRKCWRYRAEQKATGQANLQYIRHGRFYVIMATEGGHRFKNREHKKLRDVRSTPLVLPIQSGAFWAGKSKKQ